MEGRNHDVIWYTFRYRELTDRGILKAISLSTVGTSAEIRNERHQNTGYRWHRLIFKTVPGYAFMAYTSTLFYDKGAELNVQHVVIHTHCNIHFSQLNALYAVKVKINYFWWVRRFRKKVGAAYPSDSSDILRQPENIESLGRESKSGHDRRKQVTAVNLNTLQMHRIFNVQYTVDTN